MCIERQLQLGKPMKVLTITAVYPSPERPDYGAFIRSQVESLTRAGVDMDVQIIRGKRRKLMYLEALVHFARCRAQRYDVIHAHYSFSGFIARMQLKTPVVVSFMGSDLLGNIDASGQRAPYNFLLTASARLLSRVAEAVIVKSDEMAAQLPVKAHVIPNGVDFDLFRPVDQQHARTLLGLDPDKTYVLFAARPDNLRKGFAVAQAAFDTVAKTNPRLELLVAQAESQERLALFFNACDVLLFPSMQEGSPNTVKQAMACNLPIIASAAGDIPQLFDSATRSVTCERTAEAFAQVLRDMLTTRERSNARQTIAHLDEATVAQQIIDVYKTVTRHSPNAARLQDLTSFESGVSSKRF